MITAGPNRAADSAQPGASSLVARNGRPVPPPRRSHQPVGQDILASVGPLPCDVFLDHNGRYVLYAAAGGESAEVVKRAGMNLTLAIRSEDRDILRRSLARSVTRILNDEQQTSVARSRKAYGALAHIMAPIFSGGTSLDRAAIEDATDAIDSLVKRMISAEDVVWSMVATMSKHLSTHTHAINTAVYAALLAASAKGFDDDGTRDIGRGALLHDIGKNRIPEAILDKPGPLDADEWRRMREHPMIGHQMVVGALGSVPSFAHIISEHHERADGSGYPTGATAGKVPLDSQLVAIVDAYDALTSARSYKPAGSSYNALWTMRFQMRGQFNPRLLRSLAEMLGGWKEMRKADVRALELPKAL